MGNIIRVGIVGYGNLGKGVQRAIERNPDMNLQAIFTRRQELIDTYEPRQEDGYAPMISTDEIFLWEEAIDVLILCGGSANDLPLQGPTYARIFNTVDSYDNHDKIPEYLESVHLQASKGGRSCVVCGGWDPGIFSLMRCICDACLPEAKLYPFYGHGVSQGHSNALKRLDGVKNAIQYTVPNLDAMMAVSAGKEPELTKFNMNKRECFVVAEEGVDQESLRQKIIHLPDYFEGYDTTVTFITEKEFKTNHVTMHHGGNMMCSGRTGDGEFQLMELKLTLASNPGFTGSVLVALARAAYRMNDKGWIGAHTMLDIPPILLNSRSRDEIISTML